ncbi:immunoglobulin superfamily DCC subclass member 4-like [Scleropages formosus]|uniref:Immunoglobulin superfamily DCC subclass member 4 n=1 Tax=Scleropages formosus TaxID=113540 RepID=A0A8C9VUC8_SCLFO|nr:immunoglobulin superfamily DCC subclass member 4-like [Scleropages formosus]
MAVNALWLLALLSLGFSSLSAQEKPVSVELSCGAGPVHVVLEPGQPLLLDCHLGATDTPLNITWLQNGISVVDGEATQTLPNGSLAVLAPSREGREGKVPPAVEGGYSCISVSPLGALASRSLTLHLASLSRFLLHPEPQVVPMGGAARFECQVDGLPTPSIAWEKDQVPVPAQPRFISLPSGVLQILRVQEEDAGSYRCVATNAARKRFSQEATLTVAAGPPAAAGDVVIEAPPRNTTVVSGRPTVMECMAQGHPKPLVSWSRQDGKPIATDAVVLETNLLIPDTRSHHAGVYVCRANKPRTRDFVVAVAELRVLSPPVILQPPETVSLSRGNTARFVCNSSGEPAPTLHWLRNGEPVRPNGRVKTQSPGVLLINQLGAADAGYYQCIATNSLGTACATARLSVIVREGLPSPPRLLSALPHSSSSVLLSWERPEHNSEHIIGFSVHYQQAGSGIVEYQFAVHNDTTEYLVKELLPHTAYTFYVVAYSPMGASRPSQSITVAMPEDVPIAPPQLSLLSTSPTDIHVMWLPLSPEHSRGAITRYRIDYSTLDEADHVSSVEVGGNDTQVTLRGLLPNRAYRLRMAAGTSAGFGTPSEWTLHHTPDHLNQTSVLYAPTELKVRAKMYSLHVTWQPPPNHTQVSGYKLQYRELEPENVEERVGTQPIKLRKRNRHYEITGLASDRMYEVKVWAYNKQTDGYAAVWKGRTERMPSTGAPAQRFLPPLPPSSLQASANSSTSIWLRWEKPRFSTVQIISYTVRCSPAGLRNASLVSYYTSSAQEILLGALKPFTRYALAVQSNGLEVDGPFSNTVEESTLSDRPSTPPTDLQLSALDPNSVLVSWRPPLEPNGIIVEYRILYSGNSSQPDHQWNSASRDGSVTSTEVQGLMSATRYFFKMGACTLVGPGPLSPVKDIQTPPERYELDIPSVTGIIVGVCLGLLCILLCICVSFRSTKSREGSGGLDSSVLPSQSQYRRSRPSPAAMPECRDCHELETLMPPGTKDSAVTMTEVTEQHRLMGPNATDDSLDLEPKMSEPAWNGSVSRNWASRITRYRDAITEDSPVLSNGSLSPGTRRTPDGLLEASCTEPGKGHPGEMLYSSASRNRVEAEVIVHSELSDPECEQDTSSEVASSLGSLSPSLKDVAPAPEPVGPWDPESQPQEEGSPQPFPKLAAELQTDHTGQQEGGGNGSSPTTSPGVELTNGFHSPEHLENGNPLQPENRHFLSGKGLPPPLASSPSPFNSALHSYVCP